MTTAITAVIITVIVCFTIWKTIHDHHTAKRQIKKALEGYSLDLLERLHTAVRDSNKAVEKVDGLEVRVNQLSLKVGMK